MSLTLELPPSLGNELKEEAAKVGLSPQEHAMLLLYLVTSLLQEEGSSRFQEAVRLFLSERSLDAGQVSSVFEELVARCVEASSNGAEIPAVLRDDLRAWRNRYVHQRLSSAGPRAPQHVAEARRPSALGKYAHVGGTSDDFAREKQFEIEREDRRTR